MEPTLGVVVPNYNGARFLKQCVDSVLAQDYPHVRCLVMDGGSSDDSKAILQSYGSAIEFVSERDRGQSDAIQKGFDRLDTALVGWLNSDDVYLPGALSRVARAAAGNSDAVLFHGDVQRIDESGRVIGTSVSADTSYDRHRSGRGKTVQPGSFYRRWAIQACGGVDASFHLLMDVDLWIKLLRHGSAVRIPAELAQFRVHEAAKSTSDSVYRYYRETMRLGWIHERDRLVRATVRRALYVTGFHARMVARQALRGLSGA